MTKRREEKNQETKEAKREGEREGGRGGRGGGRGGGGEQEKGGVPQAVQDANADDLLNKDGKWLLTGLAPETLWSAYLTATNVNSQIV